MSLIGTLQALSDRFGTAVADHLWQATLFAALAGVAALLLRKAPARARHGVWLMASLKIALPCAALTAFAGAVGLERPAFVAALAPGQGAVAMPRPIARVASPFSGNGAPFVEDRGGAREARPASAARFPLGALLLLVWATGAIVLAGRFALARRRVERTVASGRVLARGREHAALARAQARLGVARAVPLRASGALPQPGVRGILRPVIVLPEGMADRLSDDELESVFLHELAHVRRRDNLVADLHLVLCCLFWFYPVVWLIDRRLLQERERACDDEVLRRSCPAGVYASGLLKVFTWSLGPRAAGVSAAAGTALRDRVARMAVGAASPRLTAAHRFLFSASAAALALFLFAGFFGAPDSAATRPTPAPEAQPAPAGSIPQATPAPPADGSRAGWSRVTGEYIAASETRPIVIENEEGAPLRIRAATVRVVSLDSSEYAGGGRAVLVTPPALALDNVSSRRVTFIRVAFQARGRFRDEVGFDVDIAPGESFLLEPDWRSWANTIAAGEADRLATRIAGVRFDDGGTWGVVKDQRSPTPVAIAPEATPAPNRTWPPAPTPPPGAAPTPRPDAAPQPPDSSGASFPAGYENPPNAPVIIVEARTPAARPAPGAAWLPVVTLLNTTDRRVTHLKLRFKAGTPAHAVTAFEAEIPPHGTFVFRRAYDVEGDPERVRLQLLGVGFENGDIWGEFDTSIDTRDEVIVVPQLIHRPDP